MAHDYPLLERREYERQDFGEMWLKLVRLELRLKRGNKIIKEFFSMESQINVK